MTDDPKKTSADSDEAPGGEAPQAMGMFTEPTEPDVKLDPNLAAFDRVQDGKGIDKEYEREYNRRYVKEHGDHHGHEPTEGPKAEPLP